MTSTQSDRFRRLLATILPGNRFYASKFAGVGSDLDFACLPFTTKAELADDQHQHLPYGTVHALPLGQYTRLHQTSGTSTGHPLRWLDTSESWHALLGCWREIFRRIGLTPADRCGFLFSFGPFLGFWTAFDAATAAGYFVLPAGGMTSATRLRFLIDHGCTVVFATPTYALHLVEVAAAEGIDLAASTVRAIVVAGEPGGSIPETRARIEAGWGCRVFDHYGLTEVGPVAFEPVDEPGILEVLDEYIAEVIDPNGTEPVGVGETGELVLTNLHRHGSPVVRYRTGDLVELAGTNPVRFAGGIRGRADDMIHVRGNNIYPAAIEAIVRRFPAVAEFRIIEDRTGPLADLRIEIEATAAADVPELVEGIARAVRASLLFRVDVRSVPPGTLPRFEMKARRLVRIA